MPWREEFPQRDNLIYLNHAAVAPWPKRTGDAIARFAAENVAEGAWRYPAWEQVEQQLRGRLQRLIGAAAAEDIALVKNTSEALSFVAYGLSWVPGDNVVVCEEEFPSNRWVWESLERFGVETRQAAVTGTEDPEATLLRSVDERTRLISASSVQYGTGLRLDLARIGAFCRDNGILFCVDAIQSLGALPFDVAETQADFVAADGHKWMLAPEGIALFWVRPAIRDQLQLTEVGWRTAEKIVDYTQVGWEIAATAKRFECGSPNMLGIHGLEASLSLIEEIGLETISRNVLNNAGYFIEKLAKTPGFKLITPATEARRAGIVTFTHECLTPGRIVQHLKSRRILAAQRGGGVRLSPHFYTPEEQLARTWEALEELAGHAD